MDKKNARCMVSKICLFVIMVILPTFVVAKEEKEAKPAYDRNKPFDFSFYDMMAGQINSDGQVYGIKAICFWGRARTSLLCYMLPKQPRHRFHLRDIIDIQLGVGKGKDFYANGVIAPGMKIKYDLTPKVDFGCNVSYRVGLDRISYSASMVQGFLRLNKFLLEVGAGGNGDISPLSKQRRLSNVNVKFFLNPQARRKWSVNATYWNIEGRNNQVGNQWESVRQYMVGVGFQ